MPQTAEPIVIVITGPIASGKSTIARELARELGRAGVPVAVIDLDDVHDTLARDGRTNDEATWARARREAATLANTFLAEGTAVVVAEGSFNTGGSEIHGGKGKAPMAPMPIPAKYKVVPESIPSGPPYNVAQAYARAADALGGRGSFEVDFDLAVRRHKLIDAIERSSATGRSVKVDA